MPVVIKETAVSNDSTYCLLKGGVLNLLNSDKIHYWSEMSFCSFLHRTP
jgi:hypothetical protein